VTGIDLAQRSKDSGLSRLRNKCFLRGSLTAAAKAGAENKPVIAALKRCATQNQAQHRILPQLVNSGQTSFGGMKARGVLLVMLAVALLMDASCKRQPGTEQSFFPASNQVAGWAKTGDTRTFEAADLWKYIDGEAERYLKAGVQRVSTADYKFQNKVDAVADIYTMGNAEGAGKISKSEPAVNVKPVQLGDEARLSSQSLVFRKGAYLVRIVAYEESAETEQALLQLGHGIELRLAGR